MLTLLSALALTGGPALAAVPVVQTYADGDEHGQRDLCVWAHPTDLSRSTIVSTDKDRGRVYVYDLDGNVIQTIDVGRPGSIDVRYGFQLGEECVDLIAFNARSDRTIHVYKVDPVSRTLVRVDDGEISTGPNYGFTLYQHDDGRLFAHTGPKRSGSLISQYELTDDGSGAITGSPTGWEFDETTVDGMVGDDEAGYIYLAEEDRGIWRVGAMNDGDKTLIAEVGGPGGLTADVEGVAIYHAAGTQGYIIAANQDADKLTFLERDPPHEPAGEVELDGVGSTAGVDVVNLPLNSLFSQGVLIAQNGRKAGGLMAARWQDVALDAAPDGSLRIEPGASDPRLRNRACAAQDIPVEEVTIAFIGDQGLGKDAEDVLDLIKDEGADAVLHGGDFDYDDDPEAWEDMIDDILGRDFPYFGTVGNHDEDVYYEREGYQERLEDRMGRLGIAWDGDLGVRSSFSYGGVFFVTTAPGIFGDGDEDHAPYIEDQLARNDSVWRVSSWHVTMSRMQVGDKSDQAGWGVYEASRRGGAIVATAHNHAYARTHLLESYEDQEVASTDSTLLLAADDPGTSADEGRSFAFVSGLGGRSARRQHRDDDWFASIYTRDQDAEHGALFGVFNHGGDPRLAYFYFKDIDGYVADEFYVRSDVGIAASPGPKRVRIDPTSAQSTCGDMPGNTLVIEDVTVQDQPDRVLVVTVAAEENNDDCDLADEEASVTFDGEALELAVAAVSDTEGFRACTGLFYLLDPPTTTADVEIEFPTAAGSKVNNRQGGALVIYDAAARAPEVTATAGFEGAVSPVVTMITTLTDGSMVVDVVADGNEGVHSVVEPAQAMLWQSSCGKSSSASSTLEVPVAGAAKLGWEHDNPRRYAHALAAFAPAGTVSGTTTGAPPSAGSCGDPDGDGAVTASDALLAIGAAVGSGECANRLCDVNSDCLTTMSDGLMILSAATGQPVELSCSCSP